MNRLCGWVHTFGPLLIFLECLLLLVELPKEVQGETNDEIMKRQKRDHFSYSLGDDDEDTSFFYKSSNSLPTKDTRTASGSSYIACFDSWENNSRSTNPIPFDKDYVPESCSKRCKVSATLT